jgi:hypothetical protein
MSTEERFNQINQSASLSNFPKVLKQIVETLEKGVDAHSDAFLRDAFTHVLKMISFTNFYMGNRIRPEAAELSPYILMVGQLIDKPELTH